MIERFFYKFAKQIVERHEEKQQMIKQRQALQRLQDRAKLMEQGVRLQYYDGATPI